MLQLVGDVHESAVEPTVPPPIRPHRPARRAARPHSPTRPPARPAPQILQPQIRPHRRIPARDVEPHPRHAPWLRYAATPPIGMTYPRWPSAISAA